MSATTDNEITRTQVSIALSKLYTGTRPGDEMWGELDYQALGYPVDRKHSYVDVVLQKGQALVLVGEQGCGKSMMARDIAAQHGSFVEVGSGIFEDNFALGSVLAREVSTLIVEEIPGKQETIEKIKAMVASETILCHPKGLPAMDVKSPNFIFCTGDKNPLKDLGAEDRRFCVVHLGVDIAYASEATESPLHADGSY